MLSEFHVIRTIRNTKCIAGVIFYFHVNQNFVLSEFVLSGFHCIYAGEPVSSIWLVYPGIMPSLQQCYGSCGVGQCTTAPALVWRSRPFPPY